MGKISAQARLTELIDNYQNLVFSICYKIAGDYFTAEDLTQETFIAVYRNLDSFDGSNEKAWICRIATNKSIDYLRSAGKKVIPMGEAFFLFQEDHKSLPEQRYLDHEIKQRFSGYCEQLKPPYNEIARAYYLEEISVAEMAAVRKEKKKTIQTQLYRARDMLRKMYGREESI